MNNLSNDMEGLSRIDTIVFITYFILLIFIGFWSGRKKKKDAEDFFLAGGKLSWYVIGFAIIAAGISSEQFLGTVGYAYSNGLSVANWEWLSGPSILILILIFIPFYLRRKVVTMPHFLEMRYDGKVRTLYAIVTLITYVFINLAGVIYSGGYALNVLFGIDLLKAIWGLTILAGLFTIWGGMATVAWTNVFQSVLLLGGGLLVFFMGLFDIPGGLSEIIGEGSRSHLILPANDPNIPWTGLLVLGVSTNVWYYCTNQTINQATLGAKNEWHAKMGIIFAGLLWVLIAFADVFPGLIAFAMNKSIPPDSAYPFVVNTLIPSGLRGFVFAGLCGAIISTIEAVINASSTIFTYDIYNRFINTNATTKSMIRTGRITSGVILVFGGLWAPVVQRFGHIFSYFQECWAFMAIPVAIIFVGGLLWKKVSSRVAYITLLLAFPMFFMPYLLRLFSVEMNVFNVAGIVLFLMILLFIMLTLKYNQEEARDKQSFTWNVSLIKLPGEIAAQYRPWYKNLLLWGSVMVIIYILIYILFW
jgi:SSS family solute:Na+ symporter